MSTSVSQNNNNTSTTTSSNHNNESNTDSNTSRDSRLRLHVSNIPYDLRWQDLKDLFKEKVGFEVCYVEIYESTDGKSTGSGVIEVKGRELADRAIEVLHRSELRGRQLVVREEKEKDRLLYSKLQNPSSSLGMDVGCLGNGLGNPTVPSAILPNTVQMLCMMGVDVDNINNQIFVANLDYNITVKKLKEVFMMAGNISHTELKLDKDGSSRGMATIRYESAIEAIQAIAMFNGQYLYDRQMNVRMDKMAESMPQFIPAVMPAGLKGVGVGLGPGGQPLFNVGQLTNAMIVNNLLSLNHAKFFSGLFGNIASPTNSANLAGSQSTNGNHGNSRPLGVPRNFNPFNPGAFFSGLNNHNGLNILNDLRAYSWSSMPFGIGPRVPGLFNQTHTYPPSNFVPNGGMANGVNNGPSQQGHQFQGSRQNSQESNIVLVKNLPYGMTWQNLKDRFKEAGDIQFAEIKIENGKSRGMGTVRFNSVEDARRAITHFNGTKLEGRTIEVKFEV